MLFRSDEQKQKSQQSEQELYWDEHPAELPENYFSPSRLNRIMIKNVGKGLSTSMEIGGIKVSKSVRYYKSNNGKSQDSDVILEWDGSDGINHKESLHSSNYKNNRRNDSQRNWGLHE